MTLIDYFIKTGPCEVTKEKFDAAVKTIDNLSSRIEYLELKQVDNRNRLKAHLERIEQAEARYHGLLDQITKLELNAQAGFRDMCSLVNEISLRLERVSHRLEALKLKVEPEDKLDETDL